MCHGPPNRLEFGRGSDFDSMGPRNGCIKHRVLRIGLERTIHQPTPAFLPQRRTCRTSGGAPIDPLHISCAVYSPRCAKTRGGDAHPKHRAKRAPHESVATKAAGCTSDPRHVPAKARNRKPHLGNTSALQRRDLGTSGLQTRGPRPGTPSRRIGPLPRSCTERLDFEAYAHRPTHEHPLGGCDEDALRGAAAGRRTA